MTTQGVNPTTSKNTHISSTPTKSQNPTLKLFQRTTKKEPGTYSKMPQLVEPRERDKTTLVGQNVLPISIERQVSILLSNITELQKNKKEHEFVALFVKESGELTAQAVSKQHIDSPFFTKQVHAYSKLNQLLEDTSNSELVDKLMKILKDETPHLLEITCTHIDLCCQQLKDNAKNIEAKNRLKTLFIHLKNHVEFYGNGDNKWLSHAQKQREFVHTLFTDSESGIRSLTLSDIRNTNSERFLSHVVLNGVVPPHSKEFSRVLCTHKGTRKDILQQALPQMREHVRVNPQIIYDKDFPKDFYNDFELMLIATTIMPKACLLMGKTIKSDPRQSQKLVMEALASLTLNNIQDKKDEILKLAQILLPQVQKSLTVSPYEKLSELDGIHFANSEDPTFVEFSLYLQSLPTPSYRAFMRSLKKEAHLTLTEVAHLSSTPSGVSYLKKNGWQNEAALFGVVANKKNRELIRKIIEINPEALLWADSSIQYDPEFKKQFYEEWKNAALSDPQVIGFSSFPKELKEDIDLLKLCLCKDSTVYTLIPKTIWEKHPSEFFNSLVIGADTALIEKLKSNEINIGPTFKLTITQNGNIIDLDQLKKEQISQIQIKEEKISTQLLTRKITYTHCEPLSLSIQRIYQTVDESLRPTIMNGIMKELCTQFTISPQGFLRLLPEEIFGQKQFIQLLLTFSTNGLLCPDLPLDEKKVSSLISKEFFLELIKSVQASPQEALQVTMGNILENALTKYLLTNWSPKTPLVPLAVSLGRKLMKLFFIQSTSHTFPNLVKALSSAIRYVSTFALTKENHLLFDSKMDEFVDLHDQDDLELYLKKQLQSIT